MRASRSGVLEGISVDELAARAASCGSVARLSPGPVGEVATYLPGRRVPGVRVRDDGIEIHVVGRWGVRVADIAADVRAAIRPIAPGVPVDVHMDDVDVPSDGERVEIQLPE